LTNELIEQISKIVVGDNANYWQSKKAKTVKLQNLFTPCKYKTLTPMYTSSPHILSNRVTMQ